LAAFAVAYGDSWAGEFHRERRLIGDTVAFTGGINAAGAVQSVSTDSLAFKIKRAFWSPLEYIAVPEANRRDAEAAVDHLRHLHPSRRLRVIGIERPADVIADHNILRPEKVCLGEFAVRKAARLSRSVKVQVPVLVAMLYALLCLVYPKAWVGFDNNPVSVDVKNSTLVVTNSSGQIVGTYSQFATPISDLSSIVDDLGLGPERFYLLDDLDGDSITEVVFCPMARQATGEARDGPIHIFHPSRFVRKLGIVARIPIHVPSGYPGDDATHAEQTTSYTLRRLLTTGDPELAARSLVCVSAADSPARCQVSSYTYRGDCRGTYLNQGHLAGPIAAILQVDVDRDGIQETVLGGVNNRLGEACVVVLDPKRLWGCSPPWDQANFLASSLPKGSQERYIAFPKTELTAPPSPLNLVITLQFEPAVGLRVFVSEARGEPQVEYQFDTLMKPVGVYFGDGFPMVYKRIVGRSPSPDLADSLLALVQVWRDTVQIRP
jgi:hypothetical protein